MVIIDVFKSEATILNNISLLIKIDDSLSLPNDIKYHKLSRVHYKNQSASCTVKQQEENEYHIKQNFRNLL